MGLLDGRFLGTNRNVDMSEAYSGAMQDGLADGVDLEPHQASYAQNGSSAFDDRLKYAWLIIVGAIVLLWLLGGVAFRVSLR